jgi:prephenate dehydrogenase
MRVAVVGIGLIGGSFALDIQNKYKDSKVFGIENNEENASKALELGVVQQIISSEEIENFDIVIVSVPVNVALVVLPELLDKVSDKTLVIDVGSTKVSICKLLEKHPKRRNFIATHPIAGTEFSGPEAAKLGLFLGKTNIICEVEKTAFELQERALELFHKIGFRIRYMDPVSHDKHIAYVSHLSHISSFMLGKTVIEKEKDERDIFDLAGSGFESTVRLAKSSPKMWTPIFEQNKENLIESLSEYIKNLKTFKEFLENDNYEELYSEMKNTNRIKEILK